MWLRREDHLRQALWWSKALQTGQRQATVAGSGTVPAFDPIRIEACGVAAIREEEGWHRYFTEHAITPLAITYEQLDTDYERTMRDALQHLGFDGVGPGPRPTRRQSDAVNEQWMDRFHAET